MYELECMDCGYKWDSNVPREKAECPICGAHPFYIKEAEKIVQIKDYRESFMDLLKSAYPEMGEAEETLLNQLYDGFEKIQEK